MLSVANSSSLKGKLNTANFLTWQPINNSFFETYYVASSTQPTESCEFTFTSHEEAPLSTKPEVASHYLSCGSTITEHRHEQFLHLLTFPVLAVLLTIEKLSNGQLHTSHISTIFDALGLTDTSFICAYDCNGRKDGLFHKSNRTSPFAVALYPSQEICRSAMTIHQVT